MCSQVLALVEASRPSSLQEAGTGGYKITTNNVKDLLHDANDARGVQLTSFCTLENLQDFKLDPPRTQASKKQAALVLISSILQESSAGQPASFMVDSVQLLQQTEVDAVKGCLKTNALPHHARRAHVLQEAGRVRAHDERGEPREGRKLSRTGAPSHCGTSA